MEKLKIGIIGCGVIFNLNVLGYLDNDDVHSICFSCIKICCCRERGEPR